MPAGVYVRTEKHREALRRGWTPEVRIKFGKDQNKRWTLKARAKRSKDQARIWTDSGYRTKILENRLGRTERWILSALYNAKYPMADGTAKIEKDDVYQDFYGLRNKAGKFLFHKRYDDPVMLQKARRGVWVNTHATLVAMEKRGLIEKRWTFKGYYFVLADKGRELWLTQDKKFMNKEKRNG